MGLISTAVSVARAPYFAPRLSPDGQKIAYISMGRDWQVCVLDLERGANSPLTNEGRASYPIWSLDNCGFFFHGRTRCSRICTGYLGMGSAPMERLTTSEYSQNPGSWSSDGKSIALVEVHPESGSDITVLEVISRQVTPFLNSQFSESYPIFRRTAVGSPILPMNQSVGGNLRPAISRSGPKYRVSGSGGHSPPFGPGTAGSSSTDGRIRYGLRMFRRTEASGPGSPAAVRESRVCNRFPDPQL